MKNNKKTKCKNCGAPVNTEICEYCGSPTGIETKNAVMDYPIMNCKSASVTYAMKFTFFMGLIFFVSGLFITYLWYTGNPEYTGGLLGCIFCLGISSLFLFIGFVPMIRSLLVKLFGKEIEAKVYGYINDSIYINEVPAQIVKLLVTTKEGPKFILYQLNDINKPYKINSKIKIKVFRNIFQVKDFENYYFE